MCDCSEYAQFKRDASLAADAARFALSNAQKEKEDAERQRDEYKLRFGAVWPAPALAAAGLQPHAHAASSSASSLAHTHPTLDAASSTAMMGHAGGLVTPTLSHASAASAGSQIDVEAGARAVQKQLAEVRARGTATAAAH